MIAINDGRVRWKKRKKLIMTGLRKLQKNKRMTTVNFYYLGDTDEMIECDFDQWQELAKEHGTSKVVQQDIIPLKCGNDVKVSTIFIMCLDNPRSGLSSPWWAPLIFETMTFSDNSDYDNKQKLATSLTDAKTNHADMIEEIKEEQK